MIDGGIFYGRNPATGAELTESQLLSWLDSCGMDAALTVNYQSIYFDFREGNEQLAALAKRHPGKILPVAFVQPSGFDFLRDQNYFKALRAQGFRALGLYTHPSYYEVSLESPLVQTIAALASEAGLIIQLGIRNAAEMAQAAAHYGGLRGPVLIRWMNGRGYQSYAEALHLALKHPQFYFDVGSLTSTGLIRHFVQAVGAGRLYFTSNCPESFEYTSHLLLQSAGLSAEDLNQIYGGTLANLFDLPAGGPRAFHAEPWLKKFRALLEYPKIDTHWHTEGWNLIEPAKGQDFFEPQMNFFAIRQIIASSIRALNGDLEVGNGSLFQYAASHPRIFALIVVDPTQPEVSRAQIEKFAGHEKAVGLKTIQDLYSLRLDNADYAPLIEEARRHGLPLMAHIPGLLEAARKNPDVTFICAHATYERVKALFGIPNIYFDLATSHHDWRETNLDNFIREAGGDHVLFASDAPLMSPAWTIGKLASLTLQPEQWKNIFNDNARRAFPKLANFQPVAFA